MKVNWVLGSEIHPNLIDITELKKIAPLWGSTSTWKHYKTDNCICSDLKSAQELIQRAFHAVSTLYVPQDLFVPLGRPNGLKLFDGTFSNNLFDNQDDFISLNLASVDCDIVLMLGFDLTPFSSDVTKRDYYVSIAKFIKASPDTQFVLVDYNNELSPIFSSDIPNLTLDTFEAVQELLI